MMMMMIELVKYAWYTVLSSEWDLSLNKHMTYWGNFKSTALAVIIFTFPSTEALCQWSIISSVQFSSDQNPPTITAAAAAAAAKSLQSCLTLCHPVDSSPPGSAIPGILQARMREWVAISFSNAWPYRRVQKMACTHRQSLSKPKHHLTETIWWCQWEQSQNQQTVWLVLYKLAVAYLWWESSVVLLLAPLPSAELAASLKLCANSHSYWVCRLLKI